MPAQEKQSKKSHNKENRPAGGQLKITLRRSLLGRPETHHRVARALGLTKSQRSVTHFDTPIIRGMIRKISYLLTVEAV